MFIPHVGQEVIVMFEGGDPDLPLITGRVYNAENMPPVELPGGKTKSVIRDHGGNEIIMEGHGGVQQMRLHSPKHNTTCTMGNSITWNSDSFWDVTIGGHEDVEITEWSQRQIKGWAVEFVDDYWTQQVQNAVQIESKSANIYLKASTRIKLEVGGSSLTMDSGGKIKLKGSTIDIEGSDSVNIKPKLINIEGSSAVNIKPATISLEGTEITIHGGKVTSRADGVHVVQGSTVKINP